MADFAANSNSDNSNSDESLVIVEEVSNQAPWHLARLDALCRQASENIAEPFGGCLVLLVGDLTQLGPVEAGD